MPFCPNCGSEVQADDRHCYNCGRNLDGGVETRPESTEDDQWGSLWDEEPSQESGHSEQQPGQQQSEQAYHQPGHKQPEQQKQPRHAQQQPEQQQKKPGHAQQQPGQGRQRSQKAREKIQDPRDRRLIENGKVKYAIYFPATLDFEPIVLGATAQFLSFLIVPIFTLYGYIAKVTRAAARGDEVQPAFEDPVALTKDGFFYAVTLAMFAVGAGLLTVGPVVLGSAAGSESLGLVGGLIGFSTAMYLGPAVFTLYPVTGSVTKALSPGRITQFAFTSEYFVASLLIAAIAIGGTIAATIGMIVLIITIIGIFLLFPLMYAVQPYTMYFAGAYWGATYYEMAQKGIVPPADDSEGESQRPYQQSTAETEW